MSKPRSTRRWWLLLAFFAGSLLLWERYRSWREGSQDPVILAASARYGMPAALIKAVVWKESAFDPRARGRKGEVGLMQLMPATAEEWARSEHVDLRSVDELLDPGLNTRAGTWYLRKVYQRYLHTDDPLPYALADYNAGRNNVLRWAKGAASTNSQTFIEQISFPSTRAYVRGITDRFKHYQSLSVK